MFSMVLVESGSSHFFIRIRIRHTAYYSGLYTHKSKSTKNPPGRPTVRQFVKKPVFRIRVLLSGSGSNFFFLSPDPDRQKIRIRSEKSGSRSMKKRPKNGCTSKKMLHIAYLALKSQGCPNVSFLTLLRISELVSFR